MGKSHVIVCGLGYGDEGKGSVTDYLCSTGQYHTVVRYNGGANAGHNVVSPSGRRHHKFSQFGAGAFWPDVTTYLSRFMLVDPIAMAAEFEHLKSVHVSDALNRLIVDEEALLTTPWHRDANRLREMRRQSKNGTSGVGIGETVSYALKFPDQAPKVKDCLDSSLLESKLKLLRSYLEDDLERILSANFSIEEIIQTYREFARTVKVVSGNFIRTILDEGPVVFEGAQGVLLDEDYGFQPHNTWSNTTFGNAMTLLGENGHRGYRLGVIRTYMTRHGAGPFVTEDSDLKILEPHNMTDPWQGNFRIGHFDAVSLRYALKVVGGADGIALTHLDATADHHIRVCQAYESKSGRISDIPLLGSPQPIEVTKLMREVIPVYRDPYLEWPKIVEQETGIPVVMGSTGPTCVSAGELANKFMWSPLDLTSTSR